MGQLLNNSLFEVSTRDKRKLDVDFFFFLNWMGGGELEEGSCEEMKGGER